MSSIVPVILAGGSGTRLWPLSNQGTPKQFLRLFGNRTLMQETIERVRGLRREHLVVVTAEALRLETRTQIRELGIADEDATILSEPCGRNTAPAVALAAAWVRDRFGADTRMVVLPADHHIGDREGFRVALGAALDAAAEDVLVTLGMKPTGPETGYGYIHAPDAEGVAEVRAFVEKPDAERARSYLADGNYYWNSGIFVWKAGTVLAGLQTHAGDLGPLCTRPWEELHARFAELPDISVDYALLEKADNVRMIPAYFAWSDVGTWDAVAEQWRESGRRSEALVVDTHDVDVYARRPVAIVGVDEITVVDTDEGLLVMKKGRGQQVGAVAREMKSRLRRSIAAKTPRVVPKPWGQELIWADSELYVGKTLSIKAGESLSVQYHRIKDETIHVLRGELLFRFGPDPARLEEKVMRPGESFRIETRLVHQMEALTDCDVLEVSTPHLDDVVRLTDRYGRAESKAA